MDLFNTASPQLTDASSADALAWSWKECTLLHVNEVYEFCLTLHPPGGEKSAERRSEGGFKGIKSMG
jgi:hypothetical protein